MVSRRYPITLRNKPEADNSLVVPPSGKHTLTEGLALLDGLRSFSQQMEQRVTDEIRFRNKGKREMSGVICNRYVDAANNSLGYVLAPVTVHKSGSGLSNRKT